MTTKKRFFISYAHGNHDDEQLARWLHDQLAVANQTAFLDERQKLGANWKLDIPRAIVDCDVFIVLISDQSNHSDAVHEEALLASEQHRKTGRPAFAPIRVKFKGDLSYVLGIYLRKFQWREWWSKEDSVSLLEGLLNDAATINDVGPQLVPTSAPRHGPIVDLTTLRFPGGTMLPDDPMYLVREAHHTAFDRIKRIGETIVLLGTRQSGKSSLLNRCLAACSQHRKRVAYVDFNLFDRSKFETLPGLLHELARAFLREFKLPSTVGEIHGPDELMWFLEDHVLNAIGGPVVFAIDEVDKVFEHSFRSDFFGMLRGWHNARARPDSLWRQVDLLLAISTEPHLLIDDPCQSPFNVSPPIRLKWFHPDETHALNDRYGRPLLTEDVKRLHEFLGGHPGLTQLSFHILSRHAEPQLIRFLRDATDHDGDFAPHLNALHRHLRRQPGLKLLDGLQHIIRFGRAPSEDVASRLLANGLVRCDGSLVVPSNELYARFFARP